MPEIPLRAFRYDGLSGSPTGWTFYPFRYPQLRYRIGSANMTYSPMETLTVGSAASWFALSGMVTAPFPISASGFLGSPDPVDNPLTFDFTLRFGPTDFDDINDDDLTGIFLGNNGSIASNYRNGSIAWRLNYGTPPIAVIAEIVQGDSGMEFYAVASSRRWPMPLTYIVPSAENPIVKFQFDFGGSVLTTTEIVNTGPMIEGSDVEVYRGGPVLLPEFPDGDFEVRVRAMDSYGAVTNWGLVTVSPHYKRFGSDTDASGRFFSAVNSASSVVVSSFTEGAGTREMLSDRADARNPSYAIDRVKNVHYMAYENRTNGITTLVMSRDGGVNWQ